MTEQKPIVAKLADPKVLGLEHAWVINVSKRLELAKDLVQQRRHIEAGEFYSWNAVEEQLSKNAGGIFSGGANDLQFAPSEPLLVGVSGGADSVALLLSVVVNAQDAGVFPITLCHINHRMRGEESDADAAFCERLAKELHLGYVATVASDEQASSFRMKGSENELRDFRYAAFEKHAKEVGARIIAVAHTSSDQVETMLFRAFRGTASAGLRGIPCVRWHKGLQNDQQDDHQGNLQNNLLIVRPLIDVSRAQIVKFLKQLDVDWREDSSNAQLDYSRNFIRAEIIPRIESEFPDFGSRMENMRELIADDEELLKALCLSKISEVEGRNANSWQMEKLSSLSTPLKRRMFAQALRSRDIEVSFERVEKLVAMTRSDNENSLDYSAPAKKAISLNDRWDVVKGRDILMFVDKEERAKANAVVFGDPLPVRIPGMTIVPALNKVLFVEELEGSERKPKKFPSEDTCEAIVCLDKVKGPIMFRERQAGDCIQPFGMQELVKLKKYLHTHKPSEEETQDGKRTFVLACGDEILWVPGVGISEKLRVSGLATHVLKLLDIGISDSTFC